MKLKPAGTRAAEGASTNAEAADALARLLDVMAALRDPQTGCAWDREQTHRSLAPYAIEEAYECADRAEAGDMEGLREELGDLLFQVVFHAQVGRENGNFDFAAIAASVTEKMVRRHPHVFGDGKGAEGERETAWEHQKAEERAGRGHVGALDDVPVALPALKRALKLQKRAARVGFDWPDHDRETPREKLLEETREYDAAQTDAHRLEEAGDMLFALVNVLRRDGIEPETALRQANAKFQRRFQAMETLASRDGRAFSAFSLDEQDALWRRAKAEGA